MAQLIKTTLFAGTVEYIFHMRFANIIDHISRAPWHSPCKGNALINVKPQGGGTCNTRGFDNLCHPRGRIFDINCCPITVIEVNGLESRLKFNRSH